jgi:hypothetical protein
MGARTSVDPAGPRWRDRFVRVDSLWCRWSAAWGIASFVCVALALGRVPSGRETLLAAPVCYLAGVLVAGAISLRIDARNRR